MQNEPEQWAEDLLTKVREQHPHVAISTLQAAFAEREARLVGALESANTLLTKAVADIVIYRIKIGYRTSANVTAEYVEAINAIEATLAALKDRTHD